MVDKNQANFRIDSELWQSFREKASANGSNATSELNRFIQLYVAGEIPLADFRPNTPENLDKRIGESIQSAVVPLEAELALIKKRLALVERGQSEKPVTVEAVAIPESPAPTPGKPGARSKDTRAKGGGAKGPKTGGLSQRALNNLLGFNKTDKRLRGWRNAGPDVLAEETKSRLGTAYCFDDGSKKYYPKEES